MKERRALFSTIFWICIFGVFCIVLTTQDKQGNGNKYRRLLPLPVRRIVREQQKVSEPLRVNSIKSIIPPIENLIPIKKIGSKFYTYEPLFGEVSERKEKDVLYPVPEHILKQYIVLKRTRGIMEEIQTAAASETSGGYAESIPIHSGGGYSYNNHIQSQQQLPSGGYSHSESLPAPVPPKLGYVYKPPPPLVETTTETPEEEIAEPVIPVKPVVDYETSTSAPPILVETEEDNMAQAFTVGPKDKPVSDTPDFELNKEECHDDGSNPDVWPCGYKGAIRGTEGVDYPIYSSIPKTSFDCSEQKFSGYYADIEARCQSFHVCLRRAHILRVEKWSFLCPNGTVFSQEDFACVWWDMAPPCDQETRNLYDRNERIGWDNMDEERMTIRSFMSKMVHSQLESLPSTNVPVITTTIRNDPPRPTLPTTAVRTGFPHPVRASETSVKFQSQSKSKSRTDSSILKSESESYAEKSVPNALEDEKLEGFIVNQKYTGTATTTENVPDEYLDEFVPDPDHYLAETPAIPSVVMMPIAQQYPDGTQTVSNVPVVVMMTTPNPPTIVTHQPVGVNNPYRVTIPNQPPTRVVVNQGGYEYPKNPSLAYGVPAIGNHASASPHLTVSSSKYISQGNFASNVEQQQDIDSNYQTPEDQIPVPKSIINYELPVQDEQEQSKQKYILPKKAGRISDVVVPAPIRIKNSPLPNSSANKPSQNQPFPTPKSFLATDNEVFNQILRTSGVSDSLDDGEIITGFSRLRSGIQPKLNITAQQHSDNLGTKSQLYNANVRELYTKKGRTRVQPSDKEENREAQASFESSMSIPIHRVVQPLNNIKSGFQGLSNNLTSFGIPAGKNQVRAFLTSQEDLDPNKILEIQHFDKFALFVPEKDAKQSSLPRVKNTYGSLTNEFQSSSSTASSRTTNTSPSSTSNGPQSSSQKSTIRGYATLVSSPSLEQNQNIPFEPSKKQEKYGLRNKEFNVNSNTKSSNSIPTAQTLVQDNDVVQNLAPLPESFSELSAQIYEPIKSETFVPVVQPLSQGPPIILRPIQSNQQIHVQQQSQEGYSQSATNQRNTIEHQPTNLPDIVHHILQIQPKGQRSQNLQEQQQFIQPQIVLQQPQLLQTFVPQQQFLPLQIPQQIHFQVQPQQQLQPQIQPQQQLQPQIQEQQQLQPQVQQPQQLQPQIQQQQQLQPQIQQPQQLQPQIQQQQQLQPQIQQQQQLQPQIQQQQLQPQIQQQQQLQPQIQQQQQLQPQIQQQQIVQPSVQHQSPVSQQQKSVHQQILQQVRQEENFIQPQKQFFSTDEKPEVFKSQEIPLTPLPLERQPLFLSQLLQPTGLTNLFLFNKQQNQIQKSVTKIEQNRDQMLHSSSNQQKRIIQPSRTYDYLGSTLEKPEIVPSLSIHESSSTERVNSRRPNNIILTPTRNQEYNANKNPSIIYQLQPFGSASTQSQRYVQIPNLPRPQQSFVRTHYNKTRRGNRNQFINRIEPLHHSGSVNVPIRQTPVKMEKFTHAEGIRPSRHTNYNILNINKGIFENKSKIPVHNAQTQHEHALKILY